MNIELINTGTELMLGKVLNTHHHWLGQRLAELGYRLSRQVSVPDTGPAIQAAVRESLGRADLVITTGGLGPTSDDRTRDLIAELLGRSLRLDPVVCEDIRQFFEQRKRVQPASTNVQAMVPEGAQVFRNPVGTAPGLAMEVPAGKFRQANKSSLLIMLPGPPRELRPMFLDQVKPWLQHHLPLESEFVSRTLRTTGIGESLVEEKIDAPLAWLVQSGLELGYCAGTGTVDVRISAHGPEAQTIVDQADQIIRKNIGEFVFTDQPAPLEQVVIRLLTERRQTLAVAESCTGGLLGHRLTNVPGASEVFMGGWITYSNSAKQGELGVRAETLKQFGAVSEATAREMASGARTNLGTDYALSVTGIAGPSGGSAEKPVGTVFIGLATPTKTVARKYLNPYDRETFKLVTSQQALELLRRQLTRP